VPLVTGSSGNVAVRDELMLGRHKLTARFRVSPPRTLSAGQLLVGAARSSNVICHLVAGWTCQIHDFCDGRQAIVDVFTPGDVIGLDAVWLTRLTLNGARANSAAGLEEGCSDEPAPPGGQHARTEPNFDQPSSRLAAVRGASVA
jgi:hypothetical protein